MKNSQNPTDTFQGRMDDFRIYNRALSETEVKALYDYENQPPPRNPPPNPPLVNAFTIARLKLSLVEGFRLSLSPPDKGEFTIETSADLD